MIKIHAGVLHIELTGRSTSKQALPSLCCVRADRGCGSTGGWAVRGNVLPVRLSVLFKCLITKPGPQTDLDNSQLFC